MLRSIKNILVLLILFSFSSIKAQIGGEDEVYLSGDLIEPQYDGGFQIFYELFNANVGNKPIKKGELVKVSFVVSEEGRMTKIKIVSYKDIDTAMSVMATLKEMNLLNRKWKPASRLGKYVPINIEMPFNFK